MAITFHADLTDTTLEDFDNHFRVILNYIDGFMRRQQGVPPLTFSSIRAEEFTEDKSRPVFPDTTFTRARYTDYENAKKTLAEQHYPALVQSPTAMIGYIQVVCSVRGPRITYEAVLLATVRDGEIQIEESAKVYFVLYVARYRQDRLKLLLDEADSEGKPYAKLFSDWLEPRWGDAVKLQPVEDAPPSDERERQKRWQPRSEADQWLIDQYFDVHKAHRSLAYFKEYWIRLREEELVQIPTDIDNSMAQIITKERKRRAGE